MSTPQYHQLRASITDDHIRKVFDVLLEHVGQDNAINIDDIAHAVYQSRGDNAVRKARDVIEILRTDYRIPVCSTSGKTGRWLAASEEEKEMCIRDYAARLESTQKVINALRAAKVPASSELRPVEKPVQQRLWW